MTTDLSHQVPPRDEDYPLKAQVPPGADTIEALRAEREAALMAKVESLQAENDGLTKAAADVILGAVLIPGLPNIEGVKQEIMDRLRFMIDHDDIAAAAARAFQEWIKGTALGAGDE